MLKIEKTWYYLIFLLFTFALTHWSWIFNFSIISAMDWGYHHTDSLIQFLRWPSLWNFTAFGNTSPGIAFDPLRFITAIIAQFNIDYTLIFRLVYIYPIMIFSCFASFFLIKKITKSNMAATIGSLFYIYNTYFLTLEAAGHLLLRLGFAIAPLIILLFIKTLEERKTVWLSLTTLLCFIVTIFDFRVFYLISWILILYFLYYIIIIKKNLNLKKILELSIYTITPIILVLFLNFYWLIALFSKTLDNSTVLHRGLFGNEFLNILYAFTTYAPFWTGNELKYFENQVIPAYFWLIPIIAWIGLWLNRKNKKILFWGIIALLGILLTKQAGQPFTHLYSFLFNHLPGFNAFREASKFYFFITLSYAILISSFISYIWQKLQKGKKQIYLKYFLVCLLALMFIWNSKPLITQKISNMFIPTKIPADFLIYKEFISHQKDFCRTLNIPENSRWNINTINHQHTANDIYTDHLIEYPKEYSNQFFDISSIRFVIIPIISDDIYLKQHFDKRQEYIDKISHSKFLEKININTQELIVYENIDYRPLLYSTPELETIYENIPFTKIDYQYLHPTEYKISIDNISQPVYINFSENYHASWSIKPGQFKWYQVLFKQNYFLPQDYHFKNNAGLNSFLIDPQYIKNNFNKSDYQLNPDGSLNLNLTLYFEQQSIVYAGTIVSVTTFFLLIILLCKDLVYYLIKQCKKSKKS